MAEYGESFETFLKKTSGGEITLYEPAYRGEQIPLKTLNGNTILLRTQEKFNLPWIVYCCEIDGLEVVFEFCYLDAIADVDVGKDAAYSEISMQLSPMYPTAKNFKEKDREAFHSIIEKEILLDANTPVTASVFDYNEENYWHRINYRFRYENTLVSVWNYSADGYDSMNDDFMSALSFICARDRAADGEQEVEQGSLFFKTAEELDPSLRAYFPEMTDDAYELLQIEVNEYNVFYYYVPLGAKAFDSETGLVVTFPREESATMEAVGKQFNASFEEDGTFFVAETNSRFFPLQDRYYEISYPKQDTVCDKAIIRLVENK